MASKSVMIQDIRPVFAILAPQILSDWKFVLRRLGVPEADIHEVMSLNRDRKPAEIVYRGLMRWELLCGGQPSMDALIQALHDLRLEDAADTISKYRVLRQVSGPPTYSKPRPRRNLRMFRTPSPDRQPLISDRDRGEIVLRHNEHPLATYRERLYRDPAPDILNRSFDQTTQYPNNVLGNPVRRHSWSADHPTLLSNRLRYTYVSRVISPPTKFNRDPWFTSVGFLLNGDVILLDRENRQIEIHQCRVLRTCRRYVFSHSFKICKDDHGSMPSDLVVYESYIVIIDRGQRSLRIFTPDGKNAGSVKFRNQPRCIAVSGNTFAIAFWDTSVLKGSIVLYKAAIEKAPIGQGRKLTLVNPRHVESASHCYDNVALNSFGDVISLSDDGNLYLHSIKNSLQPIYVCRNEASIPRVRSMVVKGDVIVVCNTYQDNVAAIGLTQHEPRTFDLTNMNTILSDNDGLYAPRAMAFYGDDLLVVHRYGADVHVFGSVAKSVPKSCNGLETFSL